MRNLILFSIVANALVAGFIASRIGHPYVVWPACTFLACIFVALILGLVLPHKSKPGSQPTMPAQRVMGSRRKSQP